MDIRMMLGLLHQVEQLRKRDHWTRSQLETYQLQALGRLREYTYAHSPFYQRFHRGLMDRPLQELPILTKAGLMEHFDDLVTDRAVHLDDIRAYIATAGEGRQFLDRYWVNATSGSTGQPGLFLFDRAAWTMVLASFARGHEWAGVPVSLTHRMKMASVASTDPWHMSAQVGATLRSWWMPALRLAASDPLATILAQLNAGQPEMLVCYASMARVLADAQHAGRLQIAPHLVFTSSEVLTAETRQRVAAAWGHPPFNQYAATESGGLGAECSEHQGLHLFEDLVICEVVDAQYRPVPPGSWGDKLLITVLFNHTQPLIRYELSDSVRVALAPDGCGRPFALLDGIQGRAEETLRFPTPSGEVAVHPSTFHPLLDTVPASEWQVVQEADHGLRILLGGVRDGLLPEPLVKQLQHALAAQGVTVPYLKIESVPAIPRTAAGKAPLIRSNRPVAAPGAPGLLVG